jgi:hypothetical protein
MLSFATSAKIISLKNQSSGHRSACLSEIVRFQYWKSIWKFDESQLLLYCSSEQMPQLLVVVYSSSSYFSFLTARSGVLEKR